MCPERFLRIHRNGIIESVSQQRDLLFAHRIDGGPLANCSLTWREVTIRLELERESYFIINGRLASYHGNWRTRSREVFI